MDGSLLPQTQGVHKYESAQVSCTKYQNRHECTTARAQWLEMLQHFSQLTKDTYAQCHGVMRGEHIGASLMCCAIKQFDPVTWIHKHNIKTEFNYGNFPTDWQR